MEGEGNCSSAKRVLPSTIDADRYPSDKIRSGVMVFKDFCILNGAISDPNCMKVSSNNTKSHKMSEHGCKQNTLLCLSK